jgi:hypothetical protein
VVGDQTIEADFDETLAERDVRKGAALDIMWV